MYVFFGAGKIGRRMLEFCRWCGTEPAYFVDNNPVLVDKEIEGIPVISLQSALHINKAIYMVTCLNAEQIIIQLQECGIDDARILRANSEDMVWDYISKQESISLPYKKELIGNKNKILFDLSNGLVLGGVETWSIQTAEMLKSMGYEVCLFVNAARPKVMETNIETLFIDVEGGIIDCINQVIASEARYIVCNFVGFNFRAACTLKKIFGERLKVIAIIHNDEDIYYENYVQMQECIDKCLVISTRIKEKFLKKGFPENKCEYLPWEIETPKILTKTYIDENQPIHIGYAGRLTVIQKRVDLLLDVGERLHRCKVSYRLEIAGNGDYEIELDKRIKQMQCEDEIIYVGMLSRDKISTFWSEQDIMITCSEYEGHSISQCEAMAQGVVPIITDTSGARDDVTDGENGFVVPIGAIEQIVEKICYLHENRELLAIMGQRAHKTIKEKNNRMELEKLWKQLLT